MLNPRWQKVLRDLWGNKARTLLVVMAIAVGVFAFGSVFITQEVLLRDMTQGYESIHPANAVLTMAPFDESVVNAAKGMRQVADAEGRATFSVKVETGPNQWVNVDLFAIPDYSNMRIDVITPELGAWPPVRREVLLERTSMPLVGADIGDTIGIELPNGQHKELLLAGTVHDFNAIPANLFPQGSGYISLDTLEWLGQPRAYSQLKLTMSDPNPTQESIERDASAVTDRLEQQGNTVGYTEVREPGKHWASDVTQAFTTILEGIGVFSLILSGFLVVNTISALLAQQRRQIGMMKAIGARAGQVVGIYLATVILLGALSLLVAVPVGLLFAWVSAQAVAGFLNVNITTFRMPIWVLILEIILSLLVPVIAALIPVISGTRITVREAVSDYGITPSNVKVGPIDRVLSHIRGLSRPLLLSLRNTFRRKGRLYLTLGTLTLAGAIFIGIINVRGSMLIELDKIIRLFNYDVQMGLGGSYSVRQLEREALRVPGVTGVEGWTAAQVQRIRPDKTEGSTITLFVPPADTHFIQPALVEGRWLQPDDQNAIVLSLDVLREDSDINLGDEVRLLMGDEERDWVVIGIIDRVGQPFAYANFAYLSRIQGAPGFSSVLMVGTERHDSAYQAQLGRTLEEHLKRAGINVSSTITLSEIYGSNVGQFNFLIGFMLVMAVLLAIVGGLGLAGTMSLNVLERTREIGVMRAIGAANWAVRNIVMIEGLLIGIISWILGGLLAAPLSYLLGYAVGMAFFERPLSFTFEIPGVFVWLLLIGFLAALASAMPARRASSITVRDALAYE